MVTPFPKATWTTINRCIYRTFCSLFSGTWRERHYIFLKSYLFLFHYTHTWCHIQLVINPSPMQPGYFFPQHFCTVQGTINTCNSLLVLAQSTHSHLHVHCSCTPHNHPGSSLHLVPLEPPSVLMVTDNFNRGKISLSRIPSIRLNRTSKVD